MLDVLDYAKNIPFAILEIVDFQGHLADGNKKYETFICSPFLNHMREIDHRKQLIDIVMFDGASNMKIGGKRLKVNYSMLTVMRGVEHTVSVFFNDFLKIPIVSKIISAHKMINNIFGSGIYQKPHSVFKSKSQEFHNRNIGLFIGNETRIAGYFIGMHKDLQMRKVLQATI